MVKSLRVRLQIWYGLLVLGALVVFAVFIYGHAHRDMRRRVDEQLTGAVTYFDAVLRTFPPSVLESAMPPEGDTASDSESLPPDHLLHGLEFRGSLARELDLHPRDRPFYVVWRRDGSLLVASDKETEARFADYDPPQFQDHVTFEHHRGEAFALLTGPLETRIMVGKPVHHEFSQLHHFARDLALVGAGGRQEGLHQRGLARAVRPDQGDGPNTSCFTLEHCWSSHREDGGASAAPPRGRVRAARGFHATLLSGPAQALAVHSLAILALWRGVRTGRRIGWFQRRRRARAARKKAPMG